MRGVDDRLQDIAHEALRISPIDFGIPETGGLRSVEVQEYLYNSGRSKADGRLKRSYHQTGRALDVYAYVDGKASWDTAHLTSVATAMMQAAMNQGVRIEWGGLFQSFLDMPHFQVK